jgi:hypothetical protein
MYDTVYYFGGPEKVPITKKITFRFCAARTNYLNYLEEEKRKKCYANEQQNVAKSRMQIIKDLEIKKRKVLGSSSNNDVSVKILKNILVDFLSSLVYLILKVFLAIFENTCKTHGKVREFVNS